jgi:hypothetical protein
MATSTKNKASRKATASKKTTKKSAAGDAEVTIDRRRSGRRDASAKDKESSQPAEKLERRQKVNRRRQIDPTTCERDYTDQEVEFMNALDNYKRQSGRMFPTCSEVLEVLRGLGYVKLSAAELAGMPNTESQACSAKPMLSEEQQDEESLDWTNI